MITQEMRQEILKKLEGVDTTAMCLLAGVKRSAFYAVLRGDSSKFEIVDKVLEQAQIEKDKTSNQVKAISDKVNSL